MIILFGFLSINHTAAAMNVPVTTAATARNGRYANTDSEYINEAAEICPTLCITAENMPAGNTPHASFIKRCVTAIAANDSVPPHRENSKAVILPDTSADNNIRAISISAVSYAVHRPPRYSEKRTGKYARPILKPGIATTGGIIPSTIYSVSDITARSAEKTVFLTVIAVYSPSCFNTDNQLVRHTYYRLDSV